MLQIYLKPSTLWAILKSFSLFLIILYVYVLNFKIILKIVISIFILIKDSKISSLNEVNYLLTILKNDFIVN